MPSSTLRRASSDSPGQLAARWIGVFAGPVVWAAVLEINYALSYVACERGSKWMLHLTTFAGAAIVLAAAVAAWRARPQLDHGDESLPSTIENPGRTALVRTRFITIGGLGLCAWFVIVILAMEVPTSLLAACNP